MTFFVTAILIVIFVVVFTGWIVGLVHRRKIQWCLDHGHTPFREYYHMTMKHPHRCGELFLVMGDNFSPAEKELGKRIYNELLGDRYYIQWNVVGYQKKCRHCGSILTPFLVFKILNGYTGSSMPSEDYKQMELFGYLIDGKETDRRVIKKFDDDLREEVEKIEKKQREVEGI